MVEIRRNKNSDAWDLDFKNFITREELIMNKSKKHRKNLIKAKLEIIKYLAEEIFIGSSEA